MSPSQMTIALDITFAVCAHYGITPSEVESPARPERIAWPRMIAMYLIRLHTAVIYRQIGAMFNRQQTTVFAAYKAVRDRLSVDPRFATELRTLQTKLNLPIGTSSTPFPIPNS